jgi:hypothetical protein
MRECVVFLPAGRNVAGVWRDVVAYLARGGYEASQMVLVLRAGDEELCFAGVDVPVTTVRVGSDGRSGVREAAWPTTTPRVFVMNGGTTSQGWWLHEEATHSSKQALQDESYRYGGGDGYSPSLALDVQRDGVAVLHSYAWKW